MENVSRNDSPVKSAPPIPGFRLGHPQTTPSLGFGADTPEPARLSEKYRPRTLCDVFGQGSAICQLEGFLDAPYPVAFLFDGPTGTGKTSTALALAAELGVDPNWSLIHIRSGEQDGDAVLTALRTLRFSAVNGGWKMIIVDEADYMSVKASNMWLSALEDLPARSVIVFTTNHPAKFQDRFLDRCERITFAADAQALSLDALSLLRHVWRSETGRDDHPALESLPNVVDKHGNVSFRRLLSAIESTLRMLPRAVEPAPEPVAVGPVPEATGPAEKPARPAESIILEAIASYRTRGLVASVECWQNATAAERSAINRRLVSLGCGKVTRDYTASLRFDDFLYQCVHGRPVAFPDPNEVEAPDFLADATTGMPEAFPGEPPVRVIERSRSIEHSTDEAGNLVIVLSDANNPAPGFPMPLSGGSPEVVERTFLVTFGYPESANHAAPVFRQATWGHPGFSVVRSAPDQLRLTTRDVDATDHIHKLLYSMCYKATVEETTVFPRIAGGSPVATITAPQADPLDGLTADEVIGRWPAVEPLIPMPFTEERRAESRRKVIASLEADVWALVMPIITVAKDVRPDDEGYLNSASSRAWLSMDDEACERFGRWLDMIGYRPGRADFGPLGTEEMFYEFIQECADGATLYHPIPDPTGPRGTDHGQDADAVDDDQRRAGHPVSARQLPGCGCRPIDDQPVAGWPARDRTGRPGLGMGDDGSADRRGPLAPDQGVCGNGRAAGPVGMTPPAHHQADADCRYRARWDRAPVPDFSDATPGKPAGSAPITAPRDTATPGKPADTIRIGATLYGLSIDRGTFVLDRADGTTYHIDVNAIGPECSCPSWQHRCKGLWGAHCKHTRALVDAGLIPPAPHADPLTSGLHFHPEETAMPSLESLGLAPICGGSEEAPMKLEAENVRARTIIDAAKGLHEACRSAWDNDDDEAFAEAYRLVEAGMHETLDQGNEIDGWVGGCISHYDTLEAVRRILLSYGADRKATR